MSVKAETTVQAASGTTAAPQAGGRLRTHIIKGAAGSFVLQVGFAGFAFLNAIILARGCWVRRVTALLPMPWPE